jgi:hypothetical protein
MTASSQPMAFFHIDGNVPAWNFAARYAGAGGHIATLPEIIDARLATGIGDLPWEAYFTTNSAEYYGIGADGREKLIVAHGVGPMSTIEGVKRAYAWEYKDKSRRRSGGRISALEFLKLEAGEYGEVNEVDMGEYLGTWDDAFFGFRSTREAWSDSLLLARFGPRAHEYLARHAQLALNWHEEHSVPLPLDGRPYMIQVNGAANCPYTTFAEVGGRYWSRPIPRPLESGMAMVHLLSVTQLVHTHASNLREHWQGLTCDVSCHEWADGARFIGVPDGATWQNGVAEFPQPHKVLARDWQRLMRPNEDALYVPPRLYHLARKASGWFTEYPKPPTGERMDSGDIEFRVRGVSHVGGQRQFKVDAMFFLRYNLSQVVALAPDGANAYEIVEVSRRDSDGLTTVTVQFYEVDVDTSQRLPRTNEIKQDYDLLVG